MNRMSPGRRIHSISEFVSLVRNSSERGLVVAGVDRLVELDQPERQQGRERHPRQPDVERPEADLGEPIRPSVVRDQVAQAEQRQADGEHPVDAHHRRVSVVRGQRGADLVVGDDRQVDQEAEDPGAEEVPEADGDEEHHRPAVRERGRRAALLARAELEEAPRLDGQEGERDHLGGGEDGAERHVLGRLAREVEVVHRADHPADRVEEDVEEDDRQRDPLAHHAEQDEDVGDHHRREQLEEVLDPEVDDPEAPEVGDREAVALAGDQPDGVERRDRERREEEQPRQVAAALARKPAAQRAEDDRGPEEQPDHQQHLPEAPQVEVLEPLDAEDRPVVAEPAVDAAELADQAAEDDDRQRREQPVGEPVLSPRLAARDHRREEDPGRQERGRDEEDRELDVEGAGEVEGEDLGEVDPEEVAELGPVVL